MQFFVSNIPYKVTVEEFDQFIKAIIPSATTRLMAYSSPQKVETTQKNKGYGFVTVDEASVDTIKTSDKFVIENRRLVFTDYVNQTKLYKLHISKIPDGVTETELFSVFKEFGTLDNVTFDLRAGKPSGTGVVVYTNYEDFNKVLQMKTVNVSGHDVEITKRRMIRPMNNQTKFVPKKLTRPLKIVRAVK